jgi:hypothetical protein
MGEEDEGNAAAAERLFILFFSFRVCIDQVRAEKRFLSSMAPFIRRDGSIFFPSKQAVLDASSTPL